MADGVLRGGAMWDERYRAEPYAYGLEPNAFLAAQRHRLKAGMNALVPGDGEGRNGVWLAGLGLEVDTFDLSAEGVAKARRLAGERGVADQRGPGRRAALGLAGSALRPRRPDLPASRRARAARPARKSARLAQARRPSRPRSLPSRADRAARGRSARRAPRHGAALCARCARGGFRRAGDPSARGGRGADRGGSSARRRQRGRAGAGAEAISLRSRRFGRVPPDPAGGGERFRR